MGTDPKELKSLFHLTALQNLEQILITGLSARANLSRFEDVADEEIVSHRVKHNLNGLVPFHFFAGTPFAGIVQEKYSDHSFVFLTIKRSLAEKKDFKILPQHPLSLNPPILYDYKEGYSLINWELMALRDYHSQECKNCCMAECLSADTVLCTDIFAIYCKNDTDKGKVEKMLKKHEISGIFVNSNEAMFKKC